MPAVPMDPRIFFRPLSSHLAFHGFSERCKQGDSWYHEQDQQCNWCSEQDTQLVEKPEAPQKRWRDTQQVEEPETPLVGGSQRPPRSMWYTMWPRSSWMGSSGRLGGAGRSTR